MYGVWWGRATTETFKIPSTLPLDSNFTSASWPEPTGLGHEEGRGWVEGHEAAPAREANWARSTVVLEMVSVRPFTAT